MLQKHHSNTTEETTGERMDGPDHCYGISACTSEDLGSTYLIFEQLYRFRSRRRRQHLEELCDVVLMVKHREKDGVFILLTCPGIQRKVRSRYPKEGALQSRKVQSRKAWGLGKGMGMGKKKRVTY